MIKCPVCNEELKRTKLGFTCRKAHHYDIARSGYINLLNSHKKSHGDDFEMVESRAAFLNQGYYEPLANELIKIVKKINAENLLDLGCGEGYYTDMIQKSCADTNFFGVDLSKHAIQLASRKNSFVQYIIANNFKLPILSKAMDAVIAIFTPFSIAEITRVLVENGYFIKVNPQARHLFELKSVLYDSPYLNEKEVLNHLKFTCIDLKRVTYTRVLDGSADIKALFRMTPYYWRTSINGAAALENISKLQITFDFGIEVYQQI